MVAVSVTTSSNTEYAELPLLGATIQAAVSYLEQYLVLQGTLDIFVDFSVTATGRFSGNGALTNSGKVNGIDRWIPSVSVEAGNGIDPQPGVADLTISIDPGSSYLAGLWWDPNIATSLSANPPAGQTDAFTVVLHELLHGMGFIGWRDRTTGALTTPYGSNWDLQISVANGLAVFNGPATVALVGQPVEVMLGGTQGGTHLGNYPDPSASSMPWIERSNMNGYYYIYGERYTLGRMELAMLQDLGYTLKPTTLTDVVNRWDDKDSDLFIVGWETNESLVGGALADRIEGRGGNDTMSGLAGNDNLVGGDGNDLMTGGAGNDTLDGGAGGDVAVYNGKFADYSVKLDAGTGRYTVADLVAGRDGTDTLSNIETLRFSDRDQSLVSATYTLVAQTASVNEGETASFTLTTTGVADGTAVAYTLSGISAADISGGQLSGSVTVTNNKAVIGVALLNDKLTEGTETLIVTVNTPTGVAVASSTVNDTSPSPATVSYTMAGTLGADYLVPAAGNQYLGGAGNDVYPVSAFTLNRPLTASIVDTEGSNLIQLNDGTTLSSSLFLADALQLTLSTGAVLQVLGASRFGFQLGANAVAGDSAATLSYAQFATALGTALPSSGSASGTANFVVPSSFTAATPVTPGAARAAANVAGTIGDDVFVLSAGDGYLGGGGNDTYLVGGATLVGNVTAVITDVEGSNRVQLVDGSTIAASLFLNDALQLTLSTGAKLQLLGASKFSFQVGANITAGDSAASLSYAQFGSLLGAAIPAAGGAATNGTPNYLVPIGTGNGGGGLNAIEAGQSPGAFVLDNSDLIAPVLLTGLVEAQV